MSHELDLARLLRISGHPRGLERSDLPKGRVVFKMSPISFSNI